VSWTPSSPPDASPTLVISAESITNLQQTPESSSKVMLKVFAQLPGQTQSTAHVFNFTSTSDARAEANAIKEALTSAIQTAKAAQNGTLATGGGSSAAMTIANAISGSRGGNIWEDDERLRNDVALQELLLREDPTLQKTFMEARRTKPDSISNTQFTSQFWSSRVHLLRAHAIAKTQNRGSYNVFSTLKREEGGTKMNLSAEHVHLIFAQYPLMRRVYDEVVPKRLKELDFWSRFFQSRLYMRLRGEKIDKNRDAVDKILDEYLDAPELSGLPQQRSQQLHIPRIIDVEGNEENHSQRKGNKPDQELRPQSLDKVPIIHTLNNLSEKLMAHMAPSDVDPSAPIGMDEETYNNLRLRDLQRDPEQDRVILKIRDQSQFFSDAQDPKANAEAAGLPQVDPQIAVMKMVAKLNKDFSLTTHEPHRADDEEREPPTYPSPAASHVLELVRQHRAQTEEIPSTSNLPESIYDRLLLTQATTTEFLSQFWAALLSGDASRVNEVASLVESLDRAMDRIKAVADDAEEARQELLTKSQRMVDGVFRRTGKRQRIDYDKIHGGKEVVNQLLGPTARAVGLAVERYRTALKDQTGSDEG
jgi:transcription initiation factor TFIIH subunit 1